VIAYATAILISSVKKVYEVGPLTKRFKSKVRLKFGQGRATYTEPSQKSKDES